MDNQDQDLAKQYQDILDHYSRELAQNNNTPVDTSPSTPKADSHPTTDQSPPVLPLPPKTVDVPAAEFVSTPKNYTIVTPPTPPVVSSNSSSNIFKYLFFLSLLVFLGVFGSIIYTLFFSNQSSSTSVDSPDSPTQALSTVTPVPQAEVCEVNDQKYAPGETFPATDGCNTCTCGADLTISCTEKSCDVKPTTTTTVTPTSEPLSDTSPLKNILTTVNGKLKTSYKGVSLDDGKNWTVNLTKSYNKTNTSTIKNAIISAGLTLDPQSGGEAGSDWKETYKNSTGVCELSYVQGLFTLSCHN